VFDFIGRIFRELSASSEDSLEDAIALDQRRKMKGMPKNQAKFMSTRRTMMNAASIYYAFNQSFTESLKVLREDTRDTRSVR
jgi:hypothetical protein